MAQAQPNSIRALQKAYWVLIGLLALGACAMIQPFLVTSNRTVGRVFVILLLLTPVLLFGLSIAAFRGRERVVHVILLSPVLLFGTLCVGVYLLVSSDAPEPVKTVRVAGSLVVMYRLDGPAFTSAPWVHVDQERSVVPGVVLVKRLATCVWIGGEDLTAVDGHTVVATLPGCNRSGGETTQTFRLENHVYF